MIARRTDRVLPFTLRRARGERRRPLAAWAASNREQIEHRLAECGAVLFRGFGVDSAESFREAVAALSTRLMRYIRGNSPRERLGTGLYTSTDYPRHIPLALHNELSYVSIFPSRIIFCCLEPPEHQGQTPLADMGAVYESLSPGIRRRFEERQIEYLHNVPASRWPEMFETADPVAVEAFCRSEQIDCRWSAEGSLFLRSVCPATIRHPRAVRTVWFNQAHLFHYSNSWELLRLGKVRTGAAAWLREAAARRTRKPEEYPMHCRYGDGSPIGRREINHVRSTLWQHAQKFDWQAGDVLLVDNLWIAHGRMPYRGRRKVLAALADPISRESLAPPSDPSRAMATHVAACDAASTTADCLAGSPGGPS